MADLNCDYLIIGGGSAGCVLADRLSEDGKASVLVIEAGGLDNDVRIHVPVGVVYLMTEPKHNWLYKTEPEEKLDGRAISWPRGKVLGGSSSINGMVYIRGQPDDFDGWAKNGATGWDWNALLPYFKKSEHQARGADAFHGTGGPIGVSDRDNASPLWDAFIASAKATGIPINRDFNGARQEGVGFYQATIRNGRRSSAAVGYMRHAMRRPHVEVRTRALAHRLTFKGRTVTGAVFEQDGAMFTALARREVLLCGGVINSPQLLMLSGIGPGEHLRNMGIDVRADSPQVGRNLQDHLQTRMVFRLSRPVSFNQQYHSLIGKLSMAARYAVTRGGAMAYPTAQTGIFTRLDPASERPDVQVHFNDFSIDPATGRPHRFPGMTYSACQLRPESRGQITLRSADPGAHPRIAANYLSTETDCRMAIEAVRFTRRLAATEPMASFVAEAIDPGDAVATDDACLDFVRRNATSIYHPVGTCRAGSDAQAVVDQHLRVNGVDGLRVVDASIMPTLVSGNTNAATISIAERAADLIRAQWKS